jgi:hypothetical protein
MCLEQACEKLMGGYVPHISRFQYCHATVVLSCRPAAWVSYSGDKNALFDAHIKDCQHDWVRAVKSIAG